MAKISVNKLAELLISPSAARRRRIVFDQKHPSDVVVARYRSAVQPVTNFFTNGFDRRILLDAAQRLRDDNTGTDWAIDDRRSTAAALGHLAEMGDQFPPESTYTAGNPDAGRIMIAGVSISIRPDFILTFERRGKRYSGAVKLHYIKNDDSALSKVGSEYVSTLMLQWLNQFGPEGHTPINTHCLSVDVFRRSVVHGPKSTARRLQEITAACEEIAARWPHL